MRRFGSFGVMALSALALSACGGGGTTANSFVLSAGAEGSGLAFAGSGGSDLLLDLGDGEVIKVRLIRYENIQGELTARLISSDETLTLTENASGDLVGTFTFAGETIELDFLNDIGSASGEISTGRFVEFFAAEEGEHVGAFGVYTYEYLESSPVDGGLNTEGNFVIGFRTPDSALDSFTGTASYEGDFSGFGHVLLKGSTPEGFNEDSVSGNIVFDVAFGNAPTISGSLTGRGGFDFTGDIAEVPINNGAFESTVALDCGANICSGSPEIGGAFYGPDGEEIAGLITIEVDASGPSANGDDGLTFTSAAGFVAATP